MMVEGSAVKRELLAKFSGTSNSEKVVNGEEYEDET